MVDSGQPGFAAGGDDPGPDGAGFSYHPVERELIVIVRDGARPSADAPDAPSGTDTSALTMFLGDQQLSLEPLFGESGPVRQALDALPQDRSPVPDLTLFHRVRGDIERADELAARLSALPEIETAYVKPSALPATFGPQDPGAPRGPGQHFVPNDDDRRKKQEAVQAPDFSGRQVHLGPAPAGVNAIWAWQQAGGSGDGVRFADVEGAWQLGHQDLGHTAGVLAGSPVEDLAWRNHGTNVLGVIAGARSTSGIVGIAPGVACGAVSLEDLGTARAITEAADRLTPGDLLLIPLHRPGPRFEHAGRDDQRGHIPLEWWPDDFAAIRYASARGVIVIEAAGNGADSLDDALYESRPYGFPHWWRNPFNTACPSSGALLIGAGAPPPGTHGHDHGPDRSRLGFSNFGSRLDAQGWGHEITTSGGFWDRTGDLQGGTEEDAWYTDAFSGTSAAAAMVAGALACLQGMLRAAGLPALSPEQAREVLRSTGTPQQEAPNRPASQRIGHRPDIRAAVAQLTPKQIVEGTAERFWDELVPLPGERAPRLRLYVNGAWRSLTDPEPHLRQAVHHAFAGGRLSVRVWYTDEEIVGVVVTNGT